MSKDDNSKELAEAGSFGMKLHFQARPALPTEKFVSLVEGALTEVGNQAVGKRHAMIGHIKAFVSTEHGTLKVNLIDMGLGPETLNRISAPTVREGEMKFMAALVGISDHDLEEIMEDSLGEMESQLELRIAEHDHEHVHELSHEHSHEDHEHEHKH